ncbi:MAG: hypothetical protein JST11_12895 [Acidobacteria bacterium]|nr:hypothetical protein [Acidobacteriota bacterium]
MNAQRPTRGRTRELARHFLRHMFDSEWSASTGQWQPAVVGLLALILPSAMLLVRELDPFQQGYYRRLLALPAPEPFRAAVMADEIGVLLLLSVVTGVIALFVWQSLYPSTRDCLALAGLPVRPRQVFAARLAAAGCFAGGLAAGLTLLPALVAPSEFGGRWAIDSSWGAAFVAQATAAWGACVFVFFALAAAQGLLLNLVPRRWHARVSTWVQALLAGGLLLAGLRLWTVRDWPLATVRRIPEFGAWWPPVWFAGVREYLLGNRDPFWGMMAARGGIALAGAVALTLTLYLLSYRRYRKLLLEGPARVRHSPTRRWSPLDLLSRDPRQRAIFQFLSTTLARSRTHRAVWLAYIGGAAAVLLNSSIVDGALWVSRRRQAGLDFLVLFWPLASTAILLPGLRHAMRIPAELPAHWMFRLREAEGRAAWMRAVERFIAAYTLAPIYLLAIPLSIWLHGWMPAARMTVLQIIASLAMFEALFQSWQQLPFACSYQPGKRPLVTVISGYVGVLGALVPAVSLFIGAAGKSAILFWVLLPMLAAPWLWLHLARREGWGEAPLLYADPGDSVPDLGIREMRVQTAALTGSGAISS